jgi:hypothetical protein
VKVVDVHPDLRQLAYGLVKVRSYGRYDVNGFQFRSTAFEALHPLATTTNSGVVTRAICDRTTSKMRGLSPKIISRDSR